jgi:hypothetical protein
MIARFQTARAAAGTALGLLLALLAGCTALAPEPATTVTPTITQTPTATIVWFPPTETPTPRPTVVVTPTSEMRTGLGAVILSDSFEQAGPWSTRVGEGSSATVSRGRLTLAIRQPRLYLFSERGTPVLADFYAEITAAASLCQGLDDYGLLLRTQSNQDYYRYAVVCDGTVRLERVSGGSLAVLQPRTPSGDAPPGAPGTVRLGVWAVGAEMRFFLNGRHQFTVTDPVFRSGTLGVFARSGGETAVTVTFSDLVVQAVSNAGPAASPTPAAAGTPAGP